ncbi:MAG: hypothetical protein KKA42_01340 [candidate division Zixibacteria bacterium]|nr:hypothetical protein [candidate division Zixibacteria bacterium]
MTGCTQREITNEDVIGTWRLDDDSRKHLSGELQDCEAEMLLGRDGSLSVVAFPWPDVFSIEDCPIQLVTATGKWKIVHNVRGRTDVTLIIEHVTAGDFDELPIPHSFIYGGSGSGAYIYFYLGDPDSAPRIKFVRQEDS